MASESKRAALLLPSSGSGDKAESDTLRSRYLACQLYAANHDIDIVGLYGVDSAVEPPSLPADQIPIVGPDRFDLVLAVAPDPAESACEEFASRLEFLRSEGVQIVFIERARNPQDDQ